MFNGLILRTHHDDGYAPTPRLALLKADEITMEDGTIVRNWPLIVADGRDVGLNGLDAGAVVGDNWYEVYAIRNSSNDSRGLVLHRRKRYELDQQQGAGVGTIGLRSSSSTQRVAQSFRPAMTGKIEILDVPLRKSGNPGGYLWYTIEADNGGQPSGVPLATSDRLVPAGFPAVAIPAFNIRVIFRAPAVLSAGLVYWIVMHGENAPDGANFAEWYRGIGDVYSNGHAATYDGSSWTDAGTDFTFKTYSTQYETPVVMPSGFDQKCLIGFFYASSYFDPMEWRDQRAFWLIRSTGEQFGPFGFTVPVIRDGNIIFPHGLPVEVDVVVSKPEPGYVMVGGVPKGYMRKNNEWDGTVTGYIDTGTQSVYAGTVATDFGGLYVNTNSGTAYVLTPSWSWT